MLDYIECKQTKHNSLLCDIVTFRSSTKYNKHIIPKNILYFLNQQNTKTISLWLAKYIIFVRFRSDSVLLKLRYGPAT